VLNLIPKEASMEHSIQVVPVPGKGWPVQDRKTGPPKPGTGDLQFLSDGQKDDGWIKGAGYLQSPSEINYHFTGSGCIV